MEWMVLCGHLTADPAPVPRTDLKFRTTASIGSRRFRGCSTLKARGGAVRNFPGSGFKGISASYSQSVPAAFFQNSPKFQDLRRPVSVPASDPRWMRKSFVNHRENAVNRLSACRQSLDIKQVPSLAPMIHPRSGRISIRPVPALRGWLRFATIAFPPNFQMTENHALQAAGPAFPKLFTIVSGAHRR